LPEHKIFSSKFCVCQCRVQESAIGVRGQARHWEREGKACYSCLLACFALRSTLLMQTVFWQGKSVKNPLDSIVGTIISGIVLTVVLYVFLKNFIVAGV